MGNLERRDNYNRECRDPVHGFVYLSEAEWAIVDCPTFQRLRDIRQLAMAHLVYPGATHTRFEHSLGCLHLSHQVYEAVKRQVQQGACPNFDQAFRADDRQVEHGGQILRLAGLLHDLGHTPFSHTGEHLMPEIEDHGRMRPVQHEDMTARLIRETEIAEKLELEFGKGVTEEVIAVATKPEMAELPEEADPAWHRFLNDILTGELGSDRMDYLLRDAVHSGQSAGLFDHRQLIDSMTIVRPPEQTGEDHRLGLDEAGWLVGEQMVAARYLMYVALYFHKTKRIYELHLEDFLAEWLKRQYGSPYFPVDDVRKYARLTDSLVWADIYEAAQGTDGRLKGLAKPFVDRSHLRLVRELLLADNSSDETHRAAVVAFFRNVAERMDNASPDAPVTEAFVAACEESFGGVLDHRHPRAWDRGRFDKLVAAAHTYVREEFGDAPGLVRDDQTKHDAAKFFGPKDKIWVYIDGKTRYLDELSEIVSGMPDKIWRGRIYADEKVRDDLKSFCERWLNDHPSAGGRADVRDTP